MYWRHRASHWWLLALLALNLTCGEWLTLHDRVAWGVWQLCMAVWAWHGLVVCEPCAAQVGDLARPPR